MRSTFMGLETNKSGLFLQQSALYTTGHNIANANTIGYSRQRVNMQAMPGFPGAGLNSPKMPGHLGTGAEANSIQRVRDEFIDRQYRQETNKLGYWEEQTKAISQIEDILAEPSEFGINKAFDAFWKSMEDVTTNPKDTAARKVMLAKAQGLAEAFNYSHTQLKTVQGNLGAEINASVDTVNTLLRQISEINKQIMAVEPNGYVTNDLYDARDVLVDKLNEYLPVSIERVPSGGNASDVAEGSLTVTYREKDGNSVILVHGKEYSQIQMNKAGGKITEDAPFDPFTNMNVDWKGAAAPVPPINVLHSKATLPVNKTYDYDSFAQGKGKLLSLVNSYGYSDGGVVGGHLPETLADLDKLVERFVIEFNRVHEAGVDLNGAAGKPFFSGNSADTFKVEITNPDEIAASSVTGEKGNNKNMLDLAALQKSTAVGLGGATFQSYFKGLIGDLGVKGQESIRNEFNSGTLRLSVENKRAAMSSVSLDEEMTNMITFQQAYNANARMITVVDETLDKIINGMGRVGI